MKIPIYLLFIFFSCALSAQQLTYKPLNPAFGGDTFNYNWMLSSANAQNGFTAPGRNRDQQSDLERFGESLNSQILSQISRRLLQQQIEGLGDFTEPGTFTFGTLAIEVFESDEGLVINILDTSNGEQTQVIVPN
ncbi:curli production assembly/transport component CsgF [Marixanthomonas spongiae]|uniref:Curli production assembly/transport component CsgF n=1 Tax=Marixanthomonas spongiae TaxID=2174845 RepID=A0A2U0I077_9FLAO|nr:curli production assembly/transport component CsgF [Marixanthomonas spongiae]PVW14515.1 curli assembly protein CsgF [Marixanthomonas spongiae]